MDIMGIMGVKDLLEVRDLTVEVIMAAIMEATMGVIMEEDIMEVDITVDITD